MEEFVYTHKVQYYETDQMGIVHHSNYLRWMEEARTEFLDSKGFPYARMEELGVMSPVLGVEISYEKAARYGRSAAIFLRVESFKGLKFEISYRITDAESGEVFAEARSRHCFLGSDMRPVRLESYAPEVYELFVSLT